MSDPIPVERLTRRSDDLSTAEAVQRRYYCDLCDAPYQTAAYPRTITPPTNALSPRVQVALEAESYFRHCRRCQRWVCSDVCWYSIFGICEACAGRVPTTEPTATEKAAAEASSAHYSSYLGVVVDPPDESSL